ncbi:transmembrane protein 214-like isoform X1 [Petromyzon marinus]|uniref:transmembrane protein 214-like isoform X1 n=1 Tax=Petromyzon marinus TaxID=7757 RepID=UPI003F6F7CF9
MVSSETLWKSVGRCDGDAPKRSQGGRGPARGSSWGRQEPPNESHSPPATLTDALTDLDEEELQAELTRSKVELPASPFTWARSLACALNNRIPVPEPEPTLWKHPHDYPLCLASKRLRNIIESVLAKASLLELQGLFDFCLHMILRVADKGDGSYGYRIFLQAIVRRSPAVVRDNLDKYLELVKKHQNKSRRCLCILWSVGQVGHSDLASGLLVWFSVMLPVLGVKSLSAYAICYLERLLVLHPKPCAGYGVLGPQELFPVLDFAFMPNNALQPQLQMQLLDLYPKLVVLAYGAEPEMVMHTYFPSFLSRLTVSCPPRLKIELLRSLTECLRRDWCSFSVWKKLYTAHLEQSSILLRHLLENWGTPAVAKVVSTEHLRRTAQDFAATNAELLARGRCVDTGGFVACTHVTADLLEKLRRHRASSRWPRRLVLVASLLVALCACDVHAHGSYQASSTALLLRGANLEAAPQEVLASLSRAATQAGRWARETVPACCSRAVAAAGPGVRWAREAVVTAALDSWSCVSTAVRALCDAVPPLVTWATSHSSLNASTHALGELASSVLGHGWQLLAPTRDLAAALAHAGRRAWAAAPGAAAASCAAAAETLKSALRSSWLWLGDVVPRRWDEARRRSAEAWFDARRRLLPDGFPESPAAGAVAAAARGFVTEAIPSAAARLLSWLSGAILTALGDVSTWIECRVEERSLNVSRWLAEDLPEASTTAWAWISEVLQGDVSCCIQDCVVALLRLSWACLRVAAQVVGNVAGLLH